MKFTALLHHVTPALLVDSFYDLKRNAAAGIDGVTWREYEGTLFTRVHELHREIHTGAYRAQASWRVHIPKADGKLRPLGIAALDVLYVGIESRKVNWILDADIQAFFDSIDHESMMRFWSTG